LRVSPRQRHGLKFTGRRRSVQLLHTHRERLFQILVFLPGGAVVPGSTNPIVNVEQAHAKWLAQGYEAWASSKTCWAGAGGVG
jgi:hypothetical protein